MGKSKGKRIRFLARIVSMALVFAMLTESFLGSGNIVLAAEQEEIEITNGADSDNLEGVVGKNADSSEGEEYNTENLDILFEVEENRDRTSKHFRLSDGTIMAADYGMDIHYEEDGQWRDIDNRFVYEASTAEDSMEGFATAEGNVEFKFAPDTGDGEVVRATTGDYSVGFEFLADAVETLEDFDAGLVQMEDSISMENTDLSNVEPTSISEEMSEISDSEEQSLEVVEDIAEESMETEPVPITFIKGDILNESEAAQVLNPAEIQMEAVSSYAANAVSIAEAENVDDETGKVVWADAGAAHKDGEEKSLMEQASLEHAVTSVGYGNVKPGVSLQYIASGSSLKEYILLSKRQDSYVYRFEMNLGNLEARMQEDGSILLYDPADGKAVYEIPASYMTDAAGAYSDEVGMELAEAEDGRYILTLTADAAWIDAEERVFPVQIDPTLNQLFSNESDIKGFYVIEEQEEKSTENYGRMLVGYDGSGYGNMTTYIQLKNLEALPRDSVICAAYFNMAVVYWDECECPKLHIQAKRLAEKSDWNEEYCYKKCPAVSDEVLDRQTLTTADLGTYAAWNITELVKEHYEAGNKPAAVLDFALESTGGMRDGYYVNAGLNLTWISGAKPVLQTFYRDTI